MRPECRGEFRLLYDSRGRVRKFGAACGPADRRPATYFPVRPSMATSLLGPYGPAWGYIAAVSKSLPLSPTPHEKPLFQRARA
jgi:hypothetical protein